MHDLLGASWAFSAEKKEGNMHMQSADVGAWLARLIASIREIFQRRGWLAFRFDFFFPCQSLRA